MTDLALLATRLFAEHEQYDCDPDPCLEAIIPGSMARLPVIDSEGLAYDAQVYWGLPRLGGRLWDQEVRVLLRVATLEHPSLPAVVDGGYREDLSLAYVITRRAEFTLADDGAISSLHHDRAETFQHLHSLVEGLSILRSQGVLHRNIWPGSVFGTNKDDPDQFGFEVLQLARFELSAWLHNALRGAGPNEAELRRLVFDQRPDLSLLHAAPEQLDQLLLGQPADLEDGASDLFSIGALAATMLVPDLKPMRRSLDRTSSARARDQLSQAHRDLRSAVGASDLPGPLRELLTDLLSERSDSRGGTVFDALDRLVAMRDGVLGLWEQRSDDERLVVFMPDRFDSTLARWGYLASVDLSSRDGVKEIRERLERDLGSAWVVRSQRGAVDFVRDDEPEKRKEATTVILGREFIWFAQPYRQRGAGGGLGPPNDRAHVIKYVAERSGTDPVLLDALGSPRSLGPLTFRPMTAMSGFATDRYAPWTPLLETTVPNRGERPHERAWGDSLTFLLEHAAAQLEIEQVPFDVEERDPVARRATLVLDASTRRHRLARSALTDHLYRSSGTPDLGLLASEWEVRAEGEAVRLWLKPQRSPGMEVLLHSILDGHRIEVTWREGRRLPMDDKGVISPRDQVGTRASIERETRAVAELARNPGLVRQLTAPTVIEGFRHEWLGAGDRLRGNAERIVVDLLTARPFYALQGPPGSGKTTVVARAVATQLAADGSTRLLVTAQANDALDNLARRILGELDRAGVTSVLPLRVESSELSGDRTHPAMKVHARAGALDQLLARLQRRAREVEESRFDPVAGLHGNCVRGVAASWRRLVEATAAASEDRQGEGAGVIADLDERLVTGANLVFATCAAATPDKVRQAGDLPPFDWVIVEEAAKAWPTELAIPLQRGARWTLVGDQAQLPAHRREDIDQLLDDLAASEDEDLKARGERADEFRAVFDFFRRLFDPASRNERATGRLDTQFRMRRAISEVISATFYEGGLRTDEETAARVHPASAPPFVRRRDLVWVDTTGHPSHAEPYYGNDGEVAIVRELARSLRHQLPDDGETPGLAVLTPYHEQRRRLQRAGVAEVHTIHAFQGREAEAVIVSLVRTPSEHRTDRRRFGHLSKPEVVNVMLSRARTLLVVVGHWDHMASFGRWPWDRILAGFEEHGQRIPWERTELVAP